MLASKDADLTGEKADAERPPTGCGVRAFRAAFISYIPAGWLVASRFLALPPPPPPPPAAAAAMLLRTASRTASRLSLAASHLDVICP